MCTDLFIIRAIAVHEAAHAVAAFRFGWPIARVSVDLKDRSGAASLVHADGTWREKAFVALAGPAAQERFDPSLITFILKHGRPSHVGDLNKARDAISALIETRTFGDEDIDEDEVSRHVDFIKQRVTRWVGIEKIWNSITLLANVIERNNWALSKQETDDLLRKAFHRS